MLETNNSSPQVVDEFRQVSYVGSMPSRPKGGRHPADKATALVRLRNSTQVGLQCLGAKVNQTFSP
jgi:hypothetical protein